MPYGLVKSLRSIVESRVPRASIVEKTRGLRPGDATRPWDIVVLNFAEGGRHLIIDGIVTTVYRKTILSKASTVPGLVAKQVKDNNSKASAYSPRPVSTSHGGRRMLVPFAMHGRRRHDWSSWAR